MVTRMLEEDGEQSPLLSDNFSGDLAADFFGFGKRDT